MAWSWYPRYPGDYKRDTAHLSLAEHGAYALLMDYYYSNGPIPVNGGSKQASFDISFDVSSDKRLMRVCSAFDESEKQAVASVLEQFFTIKDGHYTNKKCDEVLKKRADISEKRSKAVNERERKRRKMENKKPSNDRSHDTSSDDTTTTTSLLEIYIDGHCHNENSFFEIFWNEYPSFRPKGNKETARKRFEPVFKQIAKGNINNETFIRRVREYKNFCEQGGNYNQHASTWLYQKGWDTDWASQESKAPNKPRSGNSDGKGSGRIDKVITAAEKAKQGLGSV